MKKVIFVILITLILGFVFFVAYNRNNPDSFLANVTTAERTEIPLPTDPPETTEPAAEPTESDGGGAEAERKIISVTVSEDVYLIENEEISLDNVIEKLKAENAAAELHDDNASLSAYEALKTALTDNGIEFAESN